MDGIIIVNKPQWYTSFDVVARIRKNLKIKKVGHTGTLDPMATGVLVVCIGKATPLSNVLVSEDKVYRTTIKLGLKTDSGDLAGKIKGVDYENNEPKESRHLSDVSKEMFEKNLEIINSKNQKFNFTQIQIEEKLKSFIGKQEQVPPIYSSIKVNGKKLYEYARENKKVEIPAREIEVFNIYDISFDGKDEITYTVHCSKGTYIRALNEDIAKALGTEGTTLKLERIKTGLYSMDEAVNLEEISEENIIPLEKIFNEKIELTEKDEKNFLNGVSIKTSVKEGIYNTYINGIFIGLSKVEKDNIKRFIV